MVEQRRFEVVDSDLHEDVPELTTSNRAESAGLSMLALGLSALSKRALAAMADLFVLASVFACWYLWYLTPEPNVYQIVSLSIFAAFVLAANWLVRRK